MIKHRLYEALLDCKHLPAELHDKRSREEFINYLDAQLCFSYLEKNQLLLTPGNVADQIYFLDWGAAKGYFRDEDNKQHVLYLWDERTFITDTLSYFLGVPSNLYVEITQDSLVISLSKQKLNDSLVIFPYLQVLLDSIFYKDIIQCRNRIMELISLPSADRYHKLKQTIPKLGLKFQQQEIASFLGISRQTISRSKKG